MKWVTREKARVDRIACPWLIARFIDQSPQFLFVPDHEVMGVAEREGAIPYDFPALSWATTGPAARSTPSSRRTSSRIPRCKR